MENRFDTAIAAFDSYNSADPNKEEVDGVLVAKEVAYARRMSDCLERFSPDASEPLRLAARCQHVGRWEFPRASYPDGRKGYLQWRNRLKVHHADIASEMLERCGYSPDVIERVKSLVMKKDILHDPEAQSLEDVVCLVFVGHYLDAFAARHDDDKVIDILKKTFRKMSPRGLDAAKSLAVTSRVSSLLARATTVA